MKKIELYSGYVPEGTIPYKGQYIYRVKAFREGAHGLGEGYPQPEFAELEPEGIGGIDDGSLLLRGAPLLLAGGALGLEAGVFLVQLGLTVAAGGPGLLRRGRGLLAALTARDGLFFGFLFLC